MTTDSQDEQLTQVNEKNIIISPISRKLAHSTKGVYYRTIFILIKNEKDEILLQQRSHTKDLYPDCWDLSVGGHVNFGESYVDTAIREIAEEMGLVIEQKDLIFKGEVLVRLPSSNEYFNIFEYKLKTNQHIKTEVTEVSGTQWMSMENIKKSIKNKTLAWYPRPIQVIQALY
jgi:isopentenyldiphosphate isomerase